MLRAKLQGDALAESQLTPEQHIEIQAALDQQGFLRKRVQHYGTSLDGEFGPNTRAAIKEFQKSIGAQATGFLSQKQRNALLEIPEPAPEVVKRAPPVDAPPETTGKAPPDIGSGQPKPVPPNPAESERKVLLGEMKTSREFIQTHLGSIRYAKLSSSAVDLLSRLGEANEKTDLSALRELNQKAKSLVSQINSLNEFAQLSSIAAQRVNQVSSELAAVVSDAPYIEQIKNSIDRVEDARNTGSMPDLQQALSELNAIFDKNRANIERDRFDIP